MKPNQKKNQKNQTPTVASNNEEFAQTPASDEMPVISVVRAEDLDPKAFAEAKGDPTGEEINNLDETAAAVDAMNRKNHPEMYGDPDTWEERMEKEATVNGVPAPPADDPAPADALADNPADVPAPAAPEKPRVFHLRLSADQLASVELLVHAARNSATIELTDAVNITDLVERECFVNATNAELDNLTMLDALCAKARTAPAGDGTTSNVKIFGKYAPVSILNWMGHRDFTVFDAKNALASFGVEDIEKTTFSRALAKGKDPVKNKVKILDLEPEEELALFEFYNLAARDAAKAADAKINAVKARIQALPTVTQ